MAIGSPVYLGVRPLGLAEEAMQFEISDDERSVLVEVLDQAHRNLKEEIYKTETRSFKDELKEREELFVGLLQRLGHGPAERVA